MRAMVRCIPLGASRESSSAFQYFFICASEIFAAFARTSSRPSLFRLLLRFGVVDFEGEGWMITSVDLLSISISIAASGSGMEIDVMAFSAGSESLDFDCFAWSIALALVILEGLLLNERVDWEDCDWALVGAAALRRVAGMFVVRLGFIICCGIDPG